MPSLAHSSTQYGSSSRPSLYTRPCPPTTLTNGNECNSSSRTSSSTTYSSDQKSYSAQYASDLPYNPSMYSVTYPDYTTSKGENIPMYTQARYNPSELSRTNQMQAQKNSCNVPPQPCYPSPCPPAHVQQARILARHGINPVRDVTVPTFVHTNRSTYRAQNTSRSGVAEVLQCCAPAPASDLCTCRPRPPPICKACNPRKKLPIYPGRQSWPLRGTPSKTPSRSLSFTSRRTAASNLCPPSEDEGALSDTYLAVRFGSSHLQNNSGSFSDRDSTCGDPPVTKSKSYRNTIPTLCLPDDQDRQRRASDSQMRNGSSSHLDHTQYGLPRNNNSRSHNCLPSCTMHLKDDRESFSTLPKDHKINPCLDSRADCCLEYKESSMILNSKIQDHRKSPTFDSMSGQFPEVILDSCLSPRTEKYSSDLDMSPGHSPRYDEGGSSPRYDGSQSPRYDEKYSPRYDRSSSPRFDRCSSPRYDGPSSPRYESQHGPRYDSQTSPRYDSQHSPRYDSQSSPRYESQSSPRYDSQTSPRYDSQSSPRLDAESQQRINHFFDSTIDARLSPRLSPRSDSRYSPNLEMKQEQRNDTRIRPRIIEPRPDVCASPSYDMKRSEIDRLHELKSNAAKFFEDIAEYNNNKSEDSSSDMPDDFTSQQQELRDKYKDVRDNNRTDLTTHSTERKTRSSLPPDPQEDHLNTGYESGPEIAVGLEDPPWHSVSPTGKVM